MISKLPWRLLELGDMISSDDGKIVAEDYKFKHTDDFEAICNLINGNMLNGKWIPIEEHLPPDNTRVLVTGVDYHTKEDYISIYYHTSKGGFRGIIYPKVTHWMLLPAPPEKPVELKQCPFCGGEAEIMKRYFVANNPAYEVQCINNDNCLLSRGTGKPLFSKNEVIDQWNKRA